MERVGFIGLGKMGLPIARNLMDRGFAVTGYRRSGSPELAEAGGIVAGSAAEVAAQADVLLSIVPDAAAIEEIICGPADTLTALRPGTIHIDMTFCEVTQRYGGTVFDRDIDFRGDRFTERITLEAPHRVVFTRIAGPVLGTIANEIGGSDDDLQLRFSFALVVAGVEGGSAAEQEYADSMTGDYLKAVAVALNAVRRLAEDPAAVSA